MIMNLPRHVLPILVAIGFVVATFVPASAQVTAFKQAVAETAAKDPALAEFYKERGYQALWTSNKDNSRRRAFLKALSQAPVHGLPTAVYSEEKLRDVLKNAKSQRDRGVADVQISQMFLQYAQDLQTGILDGRRVVEGIERAPRRIDRLAQLTAFSKSTASAYLKRLVPSSAEYQRLMAEKLRLEKVIGSGGWGNTVPAGKYEPGATGANVVALRNRLIATGYLKRTSTQTFDATVQKSVQLFQQDHGLLPDGVAGEATIAALNVAPETRLSQVIVAMERERWLGAERGDRHVLVNITDYHAKIMDNDKVAFQTRSVVGANDKDRRTPEFSDVMTHMVINPTWNVPRSIATKEYLPMLKKDPNSVQHLRITDARGQLVNRASVDFSQFNEKNFPFDMKEPPSRGNALGLVKFMFPNQYNIYLHDTPAKSLFGRERRAFSHGCVRLKDPFDFAYELLSKQEADPVGFFKARLDTGRETTVSLQQALPVHIIYRTAFTQAKGRAQYRGDVYGRDAALFKALSNAGVALRAVRG